MAELLLLPLQSLGPSANRYFAASGRLRSPTAVYVVVQAHRRGLRAFDRAIAFGSTVQSSAARPTASRYLDCDVPIQSMGVKLQRIECFSPIYGRNLVQITHVSSELAQHVQQQQHQQPGKHCKVTLDGSLLCIVPHRTNLGLNSNLALGAEG